MNEKRRRSVTGKAMVVVICLVSSITALPIVPADAVDLSECTIVGTEGMISSTEQTRLT